MIDHRCNQLSGTAQPWARPGHPRGSTAGMGIDSCRRFRVPLPDRLQSPSARPRRRWPARSPSLYYSAKRAL